MLGVDRPLTWRQDAQGLAIDLPESLQDERKPPLPARMGLPGRDGRMNMLIPFVAALVALAVICCGVDAQLPGTRIALPLRTRDRDNHASVRSIEVQGAQLAVVVMDMWNSHWDATYTARSAAIVPAMNQFLHDARAAGAVVIFSPTTMIEFPGNAIYSATRQRAAAKSLPDRPLPAMRPSSRPSL